MGIQGLDLSGYWSAGYRHFFQIPSCSVGVTRLAGQERMRNKSAAANSLVMIMVMAVVSLSIHDSSGLLHFLSSLVVSHAAPS